MGRVRWEWMGAAAGVVLVALLFAPWYELDTEGDGAFLGTYAVGDTEVSAWDTLPRVSLVWIACALAVLVAALVPWLGGGQLATRWAAAAAVGITALGFVLAAMRLIDPPLESYSVGPAAFAATALSAVLLATAVLDLRRA